MELWNRTNAVFDYLPLAATIDDVIFCVHGGIPRPLQGLQSTSVTMIDQIPVPYTLTPNIQPGEDLAVKQVVTPRRQPAGAASRSQRVWRGRAGTGSGVLRTKGGGRVHGQQPAHPYSESA